MYFSRSTTSEVNNGSPHPLSKVVTQPRRKPHTFGQKLDLVLKRVFDICVSLVSIIVLFPIFLVIAWLIHRDSPGPLFYRGLRAGWKGRPFYILKFRTMYERPDCYKGPKVTARGDGRITPYGRWLRQTKLNELPQLWNILIGEMSMVGPRPEDVDIVASWPAAIRDEFLSIRPGLTSPSSVLYRNEEDQLNPTQLMKNYLFQMLPSKLRLDLLYIRNRTILTDIDVIFWTALALLPGLRSASINQNQLIFGPFARLYTHFIHWLIMDAIVAFISLNIAGAVIRLDRPINILLGPGVLFTVLAALLFSLVNFFLKLNRVEWRRAPWQYILLLAVSSSITGLILAVANDKFLENRIPDILLVIGGMISFVGFSILRYRERLLTGVANLWMALRGTAISLGERVLVVGAGANFSLAVWLLNRNEWSNAYSIVGAVDDDPKKLNHMIEGYRVIGTTRQIVELVRKLDIGVVLYTVEDIAPVDQQRILNLCRQTAVQIVMLPASLNHFRMQLLNGCDEADQQTNGSNLTLEKARFKLQEVDCLVAAGDWIDARQRLAELKQILDSTN